MVSDNSIKIAVVGVGNLTSALVQAIEYYKHNTSEGIIHPKIGGFSVSDIQIVAAYDIDNRKVGLDLADAIFAHPNNKFKVIEIKKTGIVVQKTEVLDGISEYTKDAIPISDKDSVNLFESLINSHAEFLIINTPSGSDKLVEYCANAALKANIGVINSTPSPLVRKVDLLKKFKDAGLLVLGDDLQSQAGGTVFHKGLLEILDQQGIKVINTYQLDVSGGMEGLTTLNYDRRQIKREVKENSIKRSLPYDIQVAAGTTDYLDFLGSRRIGHYWIYGKGFLDHQIKIDIRMETDDGTNGAATLVDAIRAAKVAYARGITGPVKTVCAHMFKAPPSYLSRTEASKGFEKFISGERES